MTNSIRNYFQCLCYHIVLQYINFCWKWLDIDLHHYHHNDAVEGNHNCVNEIMSLHLLKIIKQEVQNWCLDKKFEWFIWKHQMIKKNVGSNFIFCKFDPSYWFFGQVRSNDAWKGGFSSKNFSEFDAYYINLVHNTNVARTNPKHAMIFNFLVILETLWTKSNDQGVSIWNF